MRYAFLRFESVHTFEASEWPRSFSFRLLSACFHCIEFLSKASDVCITCVPVHAMFTGWNFCGIKDSEDCTWFKSSDAVQTEVTSPPPPLSATAAVRNEHPMVGRRCF